MESAAKGKYAIAFAPLPDLAAQFMSVGAPVKFAIVKEDNRGTAAAGTLGVPTYLRQRTPSPGVGECFLSSTRGNMP